MGEVDPLNIPEKDLPLIVLSDDLRSILNWGIRWHTRGIYSHVMEMHKAGKFATQTFTFREVPAEKYMKNYMRLKFWRINKLTPTQKKKWKEYVWADHNAPWIRRRYDFLGVLLGQFLGIRQIQSPFCKYCSERIADRLSLLGHYPPIKPNPTELNEYFEENENFEVYGRYFVD